MRAGLQRAAAPASDDHGQIVVRMLVAIGKTAAENDHRVIEDGFSVCLARVAETLEEIRELFDVEPVDSRDEFLLLRVILVMRKMVVPLGNADFLEAAVTAIVRQQEGGDARRVGLECERKNVEHQADVIAV